MGSVIFAFGLVAGRGSTRAQQAILRSLAVLALTVGLTGCGERFVPDVPALTIELRWIKGYPEERQSHVETGLLWTLSFLGAALPRDAPSPIDWQGDTVILHLDRAGIDASVQPHWERLLAAMKESGEYRRLGALDIGRFVALTLCSSRHYYALTGARSSYGEARAQYVFDTRFAAIVESTVAHGDRLLEIPRGSTIANLAFVGHEGVGSIRLGTFQPEEHELLDVMSNGQLRFALYGTDDALKPVANPGFTAAGKPSKCLWCHESQLTRPFGSRTSVSGYYSPNEFENDVAARAEELRRARAALRSRIDFTRAQDHTYAELLYLAFYEPSADRLAREWNISEEQLRDTLLSLPTHAHAEFDFLGASLYRRSDVDPLAPYEVIDVPTDAREASAYEPDLLQ